MGKNEEKGENNIKSTDEEYIGNLFRMKKPPGGPPPFPKFSSHPWTPDPSLDLVKMNRQLDIIKSLFEREKSDQLIIERKYLLEIFDSKFIPPLIGKMWNHYTNRFGGVL